MRKNRWNLDKSQRIELKTLISALGLLLLVILLGGNWLLGWFGKEPEIHIPVVEYWNNVWIMESDEDSILIFRDGTEMRYPYTKGEDVREQIADIVVKDGTVTEVEVKREKVHGRILSVDGTSVEVEGFGKLPLASDYKGYRIFNTLEMCKAEDLAIGYNFADMVMENGEICGVLMVKEESMEYIRVLLKSSDYARLLHEKLVLSADCDFTIQYGTHDNLMQKDYAAGEQLTIDRSSEFFSGDRITIIPKVLTGKILLNNVNRSHGTPGYRGHLELLRTEEGIAVINQVLLEEYLYCVVPSEMPASYPDEALKAQAICARTYAYGHMLNAGYPQYGAHVDDSTSYQVYNNILEQESTTTAVKETYGQLLYTSEGSLAGTYYYSTSCGVGSDANVWKTDAAQAIGYLNAKSISPNQSNSLTESENISNQDFADFILSENKTDFESSEGWYRWLYCVEELDAKKICTMVQNRYKVNPQLVLTYDGENFVEKPIDSFDEIRELYVAKRGAGGIADELHIVTESDTIKVITEHNIRYVLNNGMSRVKRQDGSEVSSPNILPSAFFVLNVREEEDRVVGYELIGGGFGHGVGMSQNAAKHMANSGYKAQDILLFFYDDCAVKKVYE